MPVEEEGLGKEKAGEADALGVGAAAELFLSFPFFTSVAVEGVSFTEAKIEAIFPPAVASPGLLLHHFLLALRIFLDSRTAFGAWAMSSVLLPSESFLFPLGETEAVANENAGVDDELVVVPLAELEANTKVPFGRAAGTAPNVKAAWIFAVLEMNGEVPVV